ncbi:carbohydrate ABC transporter permease [Robinsoniella sp. KNHs210]|uniref:carbohydrate ABC transporter permease n=1 Tax=Robinsoniella sp. KNHs210 TaxID=1469950 RepID=UPI0006946404|nr:sugar ABC transporter permease [Robinsoniella sp. KNHs210]
MKLKKRKNSDIGFVAVVLTPAMLYFAMVYYYPTIMNVYYMFCDYNLIKKPTFVGLKNIMRFFNDSIALGAFQNTFIITIVSVPLVIIIAMLISMILFSITKFSGFFRSTIFATYLTSLVVAAIVFKSWFGSELGFLNGLLVQFGMEKVPWLSQPGTAMLAVIVLSVWKYIGYYVVVFLAGFSNINTDLYEAAQIDGANGVQRFFSITIPQLMPTIIYSSIIATITFLRSYPTVLVLTQGGPYSSTQTVMMYMFEQGFKSRNVGYASVISIALIIIILVLTAIQMRFSGALKGESEV